jgi:hypothetical protein
MSLRVFVGPRVNDAVLEAVRAGGAEPVSDASQAEAIVWLDHDPSELQPLLNDRVR